MAQTDSAIEALALNPAAKQAAYDLKAKHSSIVFTSGRRSKADQARAMAGNVVQNRNWIAETYVAMAVGSACQEWVNANPEAESESDIAAGLLSVLNNFQDSDLMHLSKHLSGDAFDVQPLSRNAAQCVDSECF